MVKFYYQIIERGETVSEEVYSYHTFLAPFIWQKGKNKDVSFSKFCDKFEGQNSKWKRDKNYYSSEKSGKKREDYAALQYFCPSIHDSIFDIDTKDNLSNEILRIYTLCSEKKQNKMLYIIEKEFKEIIREKEIVEKRKYTLILNAIRLKVYSTGIAILIFECENRVHRNFQEVKNINEYGRRISLPFIPKESVDSIIADSICLKLPNKEITVDFKKTIESYNKKNEVALKAQSEELIHEVLKYGGLEASNIDEIKLALDDRMYVMSIIIDDELNKYLRKNYDSKKYAFEKNEDFSKELYEYVFIDPANGCSCQDETMRNELLDSHLDKRWFNYGTLYGASQRSLVAFTNSGGKNVVLVPFLTQYMQIACLAVACYATLAKFEEEIAEISNQEQTNKKRKDVLNIRERFLKYQSQLGANNITFQEQGIEISELVRTALGIKQSEEAITKRLDALFSAADYRMTFNFNKIGWIVAILDIMVLILPSINLILKIMPETKKLDWLYTVIKAVITVIICGGVCLYFKIKKNKS